MPIVIVRGRPGCESTIVYGLSNENAEHILEKEKNLKSHVFIHSRDEKKFNNFPAYVMTVLETHLGYRVVGCAIYSDSVELAWTLSNSSLTIV